MTRAELKALEALHLKRDKVIAKLEAMAKVTGDKLETRLSLAGEWHTMWLPKPYVAAGWTADLLDVERRIRAAGGTL